MNLQEATMKAILNESRKTEASYSRIYKHTQDDSTFAIIGSQDQDTGENRKRELYDLIKKYQDKSGSRLGFNKVDGTYTYQSGNQEKKISKEDSVIIYDIDKQSALNIANKINQESIVWKDKDFFGILYTNGSVMTEFENNPTNNMNFSGTEKAGFGTKLKNDKRTDLGFKFEGSVIYPTGYDRKEPEVEDFIFYGN